MTVRRKRKSKYPIQVCHRIPIERTQKVLGTTVASSEWYTIHATVSRDPETLELVAEIQEVMLEDRDSIVTARQFEMMFRFIFGDDASCVMDQVKAALLKEAEATQEVVKLLWTERMQWTERSINGVRLYDFDTFRTMIRRQLKEKNRFTEEVAREVMLAETCMDLMMISDREGALTSEGVEYKLTVERIEQAA